MMVLAGALLGLALAMIVAAILQSGLIFFVLLVPFVFLGGLAGVIFEQQALLRRILADPDAIDSDARYLASKREYRTARALLLHAATLLRDHARDTSRLSAAEREWMQARVERWQAEARRYTELEVELWRESLRRERGERGERGERHKPPRR